MLCSKRAFEEKLSEDRFSPTAPNRSGKRKFPAAYRAVAHRLDKGIFFFVFSNLTPNDS